MAVATGSQIRPELSAVDYTPFLQAAGQSAQMQAQGIASFASGVSQGIQNFLKKQEEKQNEQAGIALIKNFYPDISDEAAKAGYKAAGGATGFLKVKTEFDRYQRSVEDDKKAAEYYVDLRAGRADPSRFTPQQVAAGTELFNKIVTGEVSRAKTGAEISALGASTGRALAETAAIEKKTATEAKEEGVISSVLKELMPEPVAGVPEMIAKPKKPLNPNDFVSMAVRRGVRSEEGIRRVTSLASSLVRTREAGAESPVEAVASVPAQTIPLGYEVIPKQDTKTGRWFADIVQNPAAKNLGADYYLTTDVKTGAPVAKVIPGSAADVKLKDKEKKDEEANKTVAFNIDADRNNILRALYLIKNKDVGGLTAYMGYGPTLISTNEQEFVRLMEQVRNAQGINHLMALKQASPTGAGPLSTTSDNDFRAVINSRLPYQATDRPENIVKGLTASLELLNNLSKKAGHTSVSFEEYEKDIYAANRERAIAEGKLRVPSQKMVDDYQRPGSRR